MIKFEHTGDFKNLEGFLKQASKFDMRDILIRYGQEGVRVLSAATPVDTGKTSSSWGYEIEQKRGRTTIYWTNSHFVGGVSIAVILQYGHGTRQGGYVQARDYINPAVRPIFDQIAENAWKEVTN